VWYNIRGQGARHSANDTETKGRAKGKTVPTSMKELEKIFQKFLKNLLTNATKCGII
jgi:hypothetical protein